MKHSACFVSDVQTGQKSLYKQKKICDLVNPIWLRASGQKQSVKVGAKLLLQHLQRKI